MPRIQNVIVLLIAILALSGCGRQKLSKIDLAKQRLFHGDSQQALALCNELLAENPENLDALLLRGQVYESNQNYAAAEADFTRAIEVDPGNPEGYYFRYQYYLGRAQAEEDSQASRKLLELAQADHSRHLLLNPEAAVAGLNRTMPLPESLAKPPPDYLPMPSDELSADVADPLDAAAALPEQLPAQDALAADGDGALSDPIEDPGEATEEGLRDEGLRDEGLGEDAASEPTAADQFLAERAASARRIQQLDLEDPGELPEPTLPPHLDLDEGLALPEVPVPQIVRFDLSPTRTTELSTRPTVRTPRPHTTGILQLPEDASLGVDPTQRTRPTLGNLSPFVTAPTAQTTGILSNPRPAGSTTPGMLSQPAVWSPWYRPPTPRPSDAKRDADGESDASEGSTQAKQIISMALPETTPSPSTGTAVGLLPSPWFQPRIPTTGSNSLQVQGSP